MPFSLPALGIVLNRLNFAEPIRDFVNNLETSLANTSSTASTALSTAQARYAKPAQGIPLADFDPAAQSSLVGLNPVERPGNYTLTPGDWANLQVFTSAVPVTLTVPAGLTADRAYPFVQLGAGQVTVRPAQTGGAVSVRGSTSAQNSSTTATAHSIVLPTVAATDGVAILFAIASTAITVEGPENFTRVGGQVGPSGATQYLYVRHDAPASDSGATKTFQISGGAPAALVAVSLSGAHRTAMVDGVVPVGPDTENDPTSDTYTTGVGGVLELSLRSRSDAAAIALPAAPTGTTLLKAVATAAGSANSMAAVASVPAVAAGTLIGNRAWAGGYGATRTVGIAPEPTSSVTLLGSRFKTAEVGSFGDVVVLSQGIVVTGDVVA